MELRIGIIGTGAIGREHIRRISEKLKCGRVVAAYDAYPPESLGGIELEPTLEALIAREDVDAFILTTPYFTHEDILMQLLPVGKPIFCEKPMGVSGETCKKVVDLEMSLGKRLIQVGFMRRYDIGYQMMKKELESGKYGEILMMHCAHRSGLASPDQIAPAEDQSSAFIIDGASHEIDVCHWLLGDADDPFVSAQAILPRCSKYGSKTYPLPQLMILQTKKGVVIEDELNASYHGAYDIQCEVICEDGSMRLPDRPAPVIQYDLARGAAVSPDWKTRFTQAYDDEVQEWILSALEGRVDGPNAWDGYNVALTADALVRSMKSGEIEKIDLPERPAFYR